MRNWINASHPHRFFLLDGLGALLSALMLGVVLVHFESVFGAPVATLRLLALIALVFAAYDFTCYFLSLKPWPVLLRGIALGNLLYCALTLLLMALHRNQLTMLGYAYFLAELLVIVILAVAEWRFAKQGRHKF